MKFVMMILMLTLSISAADKVQQNLRKKLAAIDKKYVELQTTQIRKAIGAYNKLKVAETKKGNLEKALNYKSKADELEVRIKKLAVDLKAKQTGSWEFDKDPVEPKLVEQKPKGPIDFALSTNGATVTSTGTPWGRSETDLRIIDGITTHENRTGYTLPCTHLVDLGQIRRVHEVRFTVHGKKPLGYYYTVEVSKDNKNWTMIMDYSKRAVLGMSKKKIYGKDIRYIRIKGIAKTDNSTFFHVTELEVF